MRHRAAILPTDLQRAAPRVRVLPGGVIVAAALTMPEFSVGAGDMRRGPAPADLLVLIARGKLSVRFLVGMAVAVLAWRFVHLLVFGSPDWVIYRSTDTRIDSILFGCMLALIEPQLLARGRLSAGRVTALTIGSLAVLLAAFLIRDPLFRSVAKYTVQGIALMPLFFLAVYYSEMWFFRPLNWKPMAKLGQYSYTFYLIHYVIIQSLQFQGLDAANHWLFIALSFVLAVAFSALVFAFLEQPLKPLRSRLTGHGVGQAQQQA